MGEFILNKNIQEKGHEEEKGEGNAKHWINTEKDKAIKEIQYVVCCIYVVEVVVGLKLLLRIYTKSRGYEVVKWI